MEPGAGFTHALRWEVVYASLTPEARQALHGTAARALAAHADAAGTSQADWLCYHQVHSAEAPLALHALHTLATRAVAQGASTEALMALAEAGSHPASLPPAEQPYHRAALLLDQAQALLALRRFQEAYDLLQPSPAQALPPLDDALHSRWALHLSQASSHLQAWDQAVSSAHAAVAATLSSQDDITRGQAYTVLAMASYWREEPVPGLEYSHQALELLEHGARHDELGLAAILQGLNAYLSGDLRLALHAVATAGTLAATQGETQIQAYAAWLSGWFHATRRAWEEGIAACQRSLELAVVPCIRPAPRAG